MLAVPDATHDISNPTQPSPKSVSFLSYHQRISNSCRILVYFQIWEKGHLFPSDRWSSKNLMTNLIFNFVIRQLIKTNTCIHKAEFEFFQINFLSEFVSFCGRNYILICGQHLENSRAYFSFSSPQLLLKFFLTKLETLSRT